MERRALFGRKQVRKRVVESRQTGRHIGAGTGMRDKAMRRPGLDPAARLVRQGNRRPIERRMPILGRTQSRQREGGLTSVGLRGTPPGPERADPVVQGGDAGPCAGRCPPCLAKARGSVLTCPRLWRRTILAMPGPGLPSASGSVLEPWPEQDGSGAGDSGQPTSGPNDLRCPPVAAGTPSPILPAATRDLDPVPAFMVTLIMVDELPRSCRWGMRGLASLSCNAYRNPVGIKSPVGRPPICRWQTPRQRGCAGVVADLNHRRRGTGPGDLRLGDGLQSGDDAAIPRENRPPGPFAGLNCDRTTPLWLPRARLRPRAGRRQVVASIIMAFGAAASAARPSIIRAETPLTAGRLEPMLLCLLCPIVSSGCRGSRAGPGPSLHHADTNHCDCWGVGGRTSPGRFSDPTPSRSKHGETGSNPGQRFRDAWVSNLPQSPSGVRRKVLRFCGSRSIAAAIQADLVATGKAAQPAAGRSHSGGYANAALQQGFAPDRALPMRATLVRQRQFAQEPRLVQARLDSGRSGSPGRQSIPLPAAIRRTLALWPCPQAGRRN